MKYRHTVVWLTLLPFLLFLGCTNINVPAVDEIIESEVLNYISKWGYAPGISVSVYSPTEDIDYKFALGLSSISGKTSNTLETQHFIYSITKSFMASSVLRLVEDGKCSLGDKVEDHIDGLNPIYINNDATIEELLSHRSGIFDYTDNSAIFYNNPFRGAEWNPVKILDYIENPATDRGTFKYSSANYILLGLIVEKITREKLDVYLKNNFFTPLNLDLKLYPQDEVDLSELAHPHAYPNTFGGLVGDGKTPIDLTTVISDVLDLSGKCSWSAGGIVGTADDLAKWGYELLSEKGRLYETEGKQIVDSVFGFTDKTLEFQAYGYGVRKLFHDGYELIGSYGRSIGDENLMFYNKDKDVCICILTNSNTKSDGNPNIDELMYAIFDVL